MLKREDMEQYIDKNLPIALENLFELIRIPTVTAKGGEHSSEALEVLSRIFMQLGFHTTIFKTTGQPIFTASLDIRKTKTLLFYDHYDVQPAEPLDLWESPPFQPEIRDGKIYGRGVADNKGEIIVRAAAVKMVQDLRGELPVNVRFLIEGEEEVSSPNLGEFVKKNLNFIKESDACIWEFGGKNATGQKEIWAGVKGICYVQLKTSGPKKDLHSALGAIVENPANHLIAALASLRDDKTDEILIKDYYKTILPPTNSLLTAIEKIAEEFDTEKQKKEWGVQTFIQDLQGLDLLKKYYLSPTCTVCGIWAGWQGEGGKTVLPSTAHAKLDFRLVPDQTPEDVITKLKAHFAENSFNIEIEWYEGYPPAYTPLTDPFVKITEKTFIEIYKHKPMIHPWNAGSGPLYLFADHVPVLSIGVGHAGSNSHSPNENVILEDFKQGQIAIARLMENFSRV